jgi:hypothetical protein
MAKLKLNAMVAALMLVACSPGSCKDTDSTKAPAAPKRLGLSGVWGSRANDVWAVGEAGTILHYDGTHWTASDSSTTAGLHAVSGSASDNVWAVGDSVAVHWDGKRWTKVAEASDQPETFLSVWTSGPDNVFIVGFTTDANRGVVRHWNGAQWAVVEINSGAMWEVWGSGPKDVWVGGTGEKVRGFLDRGDGAKFDATAYDGDSVRGIWGASADDVWAVPFNGEFQHWDGSKWTAFSLPTREGVIAVAGSGPSDVWAVGLKDTILHWDGHSWTRQETGTHANLFAVWAANAKDAWAVGQELLLHWNGSNWRASAVE